jgi:hypothetical protein
MLLMLLYARTLSSAVLNIGGVCSYYPTSVQGHDELESKAKLGKTSSHDGNVTFILINYLAANGFKGASISSMSHEHRSHTRGGKRTLSTKQVHSLNSKRGDTIDIFWVRAETTVVVVQSAPEYPPMVTTTSCFPTCENALYLLRVHHKECYNQYNWSGLECNHILPPHVVQDSHCAVKQKSIPTTLCNFPASWNDAKVNCPPQMTILELSWGKLGLVQFYTLHNWGLNSISIDQASDVNIPVNAKLKAGDHILALTVTNILGLCEIFEDDAQCDMQTRRSGSLESFVLVGEPPFKDYTQLLLFEHSKYGDAKLSPNVYHRALDGWTTIDYLAHAYVSSFRSFETIFMLKYLLCERQWDKSVLEGGGDVPTPALSTASMPIWPQVLVYVTMTQLWSTQDTTPTSFKPMSTTTPTPCDLTTGQACAIDGIPEISMCVNCVALMRDNDKKAMGAFRGLCSRAEFVTKKFMPQAKRERVLTEVDKMMDNFSKGACLTANIFRLLRWISTLFLSGCLKMRAIGISASSGLRSVILSICFQIAPSTLSPAECHSRIIVSMCLHVMRAAHLGVRESLEALTYKARLQSATAGTFSRCASSAPPPT